MRKGRHHKVEAKRKVLERAREILRGEVADCHDDTCWCHEREWRDLKILDEILEDNNEAE